MPHLLLYTPRDLLSIFFFFFFNDTATTEIYPLSLHDALPILGRHEAAHYIVADAPAGEGPGGGRVRDNIVDRKSTRLNSSHVRISYAVFCLKKKKKRSSATHRQRTLRLWSTRMTYDERYRPSR